VLDAKLVSAPKRLAVVVPQLRRNLRMPELLAIVHIRPAMVVEVMSCAFDARMKSLPLNLSILTRRHIPAFTLRRIARRR
jgi:hypothetical protein